MAKEFLDYILSPDGQKLLVQEGLVSVDTISHARKGG
jgi:ABC-type Fe3+ transport system substrate-binding protein